MSEARDESRMSEAGDGSRLPSWGPASGLGLATAAVVFVVDQAYKALMLYGFDFLELGRDAYIYVAPFFDLRMVWNYGVSYGLFQQETALGRWLLVGFNLLAAIGLWFWLARQRGGWDAFAIGLIIGGALGNALDRAIYGAVADFISLHAFGYYWYVFNIADMAIVVGVGLLFLSAFRPQPR